MSKHYIQTDVLKDADRVVVIPFNEHSAVAVYSYLAKDKNFINYVKKEPEEVFPLEGKTLKKMQVNFNGTAYISLLSGEDIPYWSIELAKDHPHVETIGTPDFWLEDIHSGRWGDIKEKYMDQREIIQELIEKGKYSFKINGYRIDWKVLEAQFPEEVAKFVVMGPKESSLEEYRRLPELMHIGEKRLIHIGRRAAESTFPGQKINTQPVTRSSEKLTRFRLNQGKPTINTDLAQSLNSAEEAGLQIWADFGIQPLIKSTVINGNGKG